MNTEPAFPCPVGHIECAHPIGMSLRDYLAAKVVGVLITSAENQVVTKGLYLSPNDVSRIRTDIAISSYAYADAMLAERAKSNTP